MGDDLDQIDDVGEIVEIMKSLHIPTKGLQSCEAMKDKLRDFLKESATKRVSEPYQVISNASKSTERKRKKLQDIYKKTSDFLDKLDPGVKISLQESFGDLKTTLNESIKKLEPRNEYTVLVAGETSAGKSSVINLILGEEVLPFSLLRTTSTICELKYGEKKIINVHFKDDGTQTRDPEMHELNEGPDENYIAQISRFVSLKTDRDKTPYKKIELFWPHPLLKENVMVVDSPGVGESEVMDEFVVNYMSNAFCFMYVINTHNAGGVQKDRLEMLLQCAQAKLTKDDLVLFTGCALFVCNKWDLIQPNEQEAVKVEQVAKLFKKLPNLDPGKQMIYLSCKTAQTCQKYGYITPDFNNLIAGIGHLIVSAMQKQLEMHFRWLEEVLFRVSRQVKIFLKTTKLSIQETEEKISKVKKRMQELQESQQHKFDELSKYQSEILEDIIAKLSEYFKSEETVNKFCKWSPDEAPEVKETWQLTKDEVLKCISKRTQQFVQKWEDETHEFASAQVSLAKFCCEKYDIMEGEIHQVGEYVFLDADDIDVTTQDENATQTHSQAKSRKVSKGSAPMWLRQGLAPVIVGSPLKTLGLYKTVKKTFHYKGKREKYKEDPSAYMSKRSKKCLAMIGTEARLLPLINEQLEDAVQCLKQLKDKMPRLLESDNKFYQKLLDDDRDKTVVREIYEPLAMEAEFLRRELTVFSLTEMRKSDFTRDELKWDENRQSIIGRGNFSTVYRGILTQSGKPEVKVAIKEYIHPLSTSNVWHFVDEEKALRKLRHPHIVKFYGTSLLWEENSVRIILVLEWCKDDLRSHISKKKELIPGKSRSDDAIRNVYQWVNEIIDALAYIHEQGIVHRDLKLDNILLSEENSVKVKDVGTSKAAVEITGTLAGSPANIAPEVIKSQVYNSKTDIYSLGILLWEIWYGEQAFAGTELALDAFFKMVDDGGHPKPLEGCLKPDSRWEELMEKCWNEDPEKRPSAEECLKSISNKRVVTLKYPYPRDIAESSTYEKERVHSEWGKNQSSSVENKADGVVQSTRYVDMEIRKLPYGILKKLSDQLDIDGPHDWEALISVMPNGMYSKEQVTSFENQRARMDGSPSMALLTDLGQRAKTVRQLVVWLKKIGNCQALDILEYKEKSDAVDLEVLPSTFTASEDVFKEESIEGIFTSEGGVMAGGNIRLVCPPGALDDSLSVIITLEDPSKYYSLIVQKDLENDVIIAAPIVNLQPNGHSFRKPIKLTTSFRNMNWKWHGDDVFILHGTEARDGKVTWQDITKSSKINEAAGEVEVELKHFSLIMVLLRWTLIRSKDILSRFDLLSFDYTLLVLLNKTSPSSAHDMLALLFVSQDVYHEQFYREDETSALVQLKKEGFIEVHEHATDRLDKKRIYNSENLQVTIQLGEDYRLSDSQHRSFCFSVDSFVWWNGGKVIKLPLEWRNEVRYLCGTVSVNGENGHASKKHFSEGDLCNYVRKLLGMEGNIFNVVTIARLLEMPEELMHQVTSSWEDDCEQLNLSLQHWSEKSAGVENLSSLRKCLEGINEGEYNVTSRGQMHIRRLRKLATKITDLQPVNTDLVRYFSRKATILCNSVLRDCCLELNQDKAFSSSNNADPLVKQFIENRQPMPEDISTKYKLVCSPSDESRTSIFLAIVPHLIQTIKEIFVDHKRLVPHSGLIGLHEDNVNQLLTSVLNARQNNRFRDLVYVECQILEKLCLKNRSKKPVAEITKWSESLAIEQMLNFLERFFKHCLHDIRRHRRLEIFSCRLRDTLLTDDKEVDEDYMQDFANILLSLIDFAKFDPSKLVRFELIDSKNYTLSSTSSDVENVVHDEYDDTYSQTFSIKKVSEDELQLNAAACVHIYGSMRKIGAFQSVIMLNESGMDAFNRCMSRFALADIAVMKMENRTVLYASQKEKLSELIQIFKRELSEDMVDLSHSEVSQCYLPMRCIDFTKEKVLRLRLVYKWGSEAVALDSNDFVTFSDCSTGGACLPEVKSFGLDNSLMSEDLEALSLTSVGGKFPSTSFDELQKHGSAQCGKIEYHLHQTFNQVTSPQTCVIGNQATVNDQTPSQRALPEGLNYSPKRSSTEGRKSLPEADHELENTSHARPCSYDQQSS